MERTIYQDLLAWKDYPDKKPLILLGARQVGKVQRCFYGKIHTAAFKGE